MEPPSIGARVGVLVDDGVVVPAVVRGYTWVKCPVVDFENSPRKLAIWKNLGLKVPAPEPVLPDALVPLDNEG